MGLRHDGNDPVALPETWRPRARVQRTDQDFVALVVPSGVSIEALCNVVRVGTSDVAGPVSAIDTSGGSQVQSDGCRPAEAAKTKCACSRRCDHFGHCQDHLKSIL